MENKQLYTSKKIKDILPGDIILHPLYRRDGLLLINRYKKITNSISKNIRNNFPSDLPILLINSDDDLNYFIENKIYATPIFINDLLKVFKLHKEFISIPINYSNYIEETIFSNEDNNFISSPFWNSFEELLESPRLKNRAIKIRKQLLKIINDNEQLMELIDEIKKYHDALYIHTINSLSISLISGLSLELSDEDLINLSLSALLADVGFLDIDIEYFKAYLDNPNESKDLIINHTKLSIDKIKDIDILRNKSIVFGIYEHHEYYNGSGFPNGKKGRDISLFGRILAVSKSYDDMAGGYLEEKAHNTIEAQFNLWKGKNTLFDPEILVILFAKVNIFKTGQKVIINDKQKGKIIGFSNYLDEPLLPIIELESGTIIDYSNSDHSINNIKFINS